MKLQTKVKREYFKLKRKLKPNKKNKDYFLIAGLVLLILGIFFFGSLDIANFNSENVVANNISIIDDTKLELTIDDYNIDEVWSFTGHSNSVEGVAVDSEGNVYSVSRDDTVKKIDSNGDEVWSFTRHSSTVWDVTVDSEGNVYSASNDDTVRKIDSNGDEVWSFTGHSEPIYDVSVDSEGNVYSASRDDTVRKIDSNGDEVWSFSGHSDEVKGVAVDSEGNVYSGSYDKTVRKIDNDGNEIWSFTGHSGAVKGVAVDSEGNVYSVSVDDTVKKIDSNGDEVWSFTGHSNYVYGVAVDSNENVYSASADNTVRKIDSNGDEVWSFTGHSSTVWGVAVDSNGNVYSASYDDTVKKLEQNPSTYQTGGHIELSNFQVSETDYNACILTADETKPVNTEIQYYINNDEIALGNEFDYLGENNLTLKVKLSSIDNTITPQVDNINLSCSYVESTESSDSLGQTEDIFNYLSILDEVPIQHFQEQSFKQRLQQVFHNLGLTNAWNKLKQMFQFQNQNQTNQSEATQ